MASNNEAKIRFTAETSGFTAAIDDANREMANLKAEMKLADATFKNTGDSAEYQQQKLELLEQALQTNHDKQEALTQKLETAKSIYGEDSAEVQKLEKQLTYAKTEEQNLLSQVDETNGGLDQQKESAEGAGDAVDGMATVLVNAEIAGKIKEIADAALDMAESFDEAQAAIVEGTGASGESLDGLQQAANGAFGRIADADTDLSTVSGTLAELNTRFGITGQDAEDMTVKMSNFGKATGTDATKAVDSMADVMHRWNLDLSDADDLLDDLTTANQSCQLTVDDLTGYLTKNSTQFQELGYSADEALAMLISLSDGGADVGAVMSGLTKGVANLSEKTDDVPGTFQKAVEAIGDCDSIAEALQTQIGDTGETVEQIFGKKAAQELATNIQNGSFAIDEWTAILEDNKGALDTTTEGVTTMKDSWTQATNNVSMALGSTMAPAISDMVSKVADVITKVSQVVQKSPVLQAVIVGVATALGILAAALAISSLIQAVTTVWGMLNTVLLMNPIFLVVTAIAALAAGLVYAYKHCETFRNMVNNAFETIKSIVLPIVEAVKTGVVNAFNGIRAFISSVMPAIRQIISTVWNVIKTVITTVVNAIRTVVSTVFNGIRTVISTVMNGIKSTITSIWNTIKAVVTTVVNGIKGTVSSVFDTIKSVTSTVWNGIKTAITNPVQTAKSVVTNLFNDIKSTISNAANSAKSTVTSTFNAIKTAMTRPIESAKSTISGIMSKIKGMFPLHIGRIFSGLSLPHIHVSGGSAPFGIGGKGSLPHFSVTWNKLGAIFKKPAIFATGLGFQGVGEAGPEAVAPIDTLKQYVAEAVEAGSTPIDYDHLANKVAAACARMNITIDIDNRTLGRVVREMVG